MSVAAALLAGSAMAGLPSGYPSVPIKGVRGPVDFPLYGIGTWLYNDTIAEAAVASAFKLGYRHVDTAYDYTNYKGIYKALAASGLEHRADYFITSKVPGGLNSTATKQAFQATLSDLGVDFVDLMLLHFPAGMPPPPVGKKQRQESWLALEDLAKAGKARAIGVSHYCEQQLKDILEVHTVPIAVNQVQYHVGMGSAGPKADDDKAFVETNGILYQSFSPLCGPCTPPDNKELITGELVTKIGQAHNKSGSQVALRWLVQQGIPVIPKSSNPVHQKENMELFDFKLTEEEMAQLTAAKTPAVGGGNGPNDSGDCEIEDAKELMV